jgi:cellulose synthase/poly-beta-1,6-N-acetylglucosamine synthase-like glycosyltransferase
VKSVFEDAVMKFFWINGLLSGMIWTIIFVVSLLSLLHRPKGRIKADVKIVVVTVGSEKVLPALREVTKRLRELSLDFITVSSNPLPEEFNVLVVPKEKDGSKFRAIKWFVENYVEEDHWYTFLDDDSYPLDDKFLYEIPYWESKGRLVGNGILVPRPGRSKMAYSLDWIRFFDDWTRFRFQHVIGRPVFGLHGELLIANGRILREVWVKMEESITEDFNFAMHLMKRRIKVFQVTTRVSVKSPNSLRDFTIQRKRWGNVLRDALRHKNFIMFLPLVPLFFTSPFFAYFWLHMPPIAIVPGAYYIFVYLYGSLKARVPPFVPHVISMVDWMSFLLGGVRKQLRFNVIDKT